MEVSSLVENKEGETSKHLINPYHAEEEQGFVLDFGLTPEFGDGFNEARIQEEAERIYNPIVNEFVGCLIHLMESNDDNRYLLVGMLRGKMAEFKLAVRQTAALPYRQRPK